MKKTIILLLLLVFASTTVSAQVLVGDMNYDDKLDVSDITAMVSAVLGTTEYQYLGANDEILMGDIDNNGRLNVSDITIAVDMILGNTELRYVYPSVPPIHEYVDLDLPSGTLWATTNIGADNPEDYGDYFAWGETEGYDAGKTRFGWNNYKWCNGDQNKLTKYCYDSEYGNNGFTDSLKELELSDDAAYVNWGPDWRMPSPEQFDELINSSYTTVKWTVLNGVNGRMITSKSNGQSIFLPAAGLRLSILDGAGKCLFYWSRSLDYRPDMASNLQSTQEYVYTYPNLRDCGVSVRPVRFAE